MTDVEPYAPIEERIRIAERAAAAIRLRNCGASIEKIAHTLGYDSVAHAAADIEAKLDELIRIPAAELVGRQQAMIMDMTRACYTAASQGDVNSVKAIRDLMDHQAKLFGLYAPTRHRISPDDNNFSENAARLLSEFGVSADVTPPPTIDAGEPWA